MFHGWLNLSEYKDIRALMQIFGLFEQRVQLNIEMDSIASQWYNLYTLGTNKQAMYYKIFQNIYDNNDEFRESFLYKKVNEQVLSECIHDKYGWSKQQQHKIS